MPKIKRTYAAPRARSAGRADSPVVGQTPPEVAAPIFAAPQVPLSSESTGDVTHPQSTLQACGTPADAAPHRRIDDYDVDKLVFWVCVLLFAIAFAWVK
jgi:hypothetical protein